MKFLVVGLGHCGGKIGAYFKEKAKTSEHLIVNVCAINTDKTDLASHAVIPPENKLCIGSGRGAARNWREGYNAAIQARTHIRNLLAKVLEPDTDLIILTLGEGGGSGSGIAPIVAEIIGELGRECIAIVTLPFERESVKAKVNAAKGLDLLYRQDALNALICVDNDKIIAHFPDKLLTEAYQLVNQHIIDTFISIIGLARMPSQADRIDESEIKAVLEYPGFATLANYKTYANMVSDMTEAIKHAWSGSLFADVDPRTASGVLFGVHGPAHLFTTIQVDAMRSVFREILAGKDVMLGVYPTERDRWVSYVGIITGLDIPKKVLELMKIAKEEYRLQKEIIAERRGIKKRGLSFSLEEEETEIVVPRTEKIRVIEMEAPKPVEQETVADIEHPLVRDALKTLAKYRRKRMPVNELVNILVVEAGLAEADARRIIELLLNEGYLIEVELNVYEII